MRVVKPWHRLLREVGDAPSLETFQVRLDGALSTLSQLKMSLLTAGGLGWMASKGPFPPKAFGYIKCVSEEREQLADHASSRLPSIAVSNLPRNLKLKESRRSTYFLCIF